MSRAWRRIRRDEISPSLELPPVVQFLYPAVKPIRIGLQRLRQP
jgi:hypothetical protein